MAQVLILATLATKAEEADYLSAQITALGASVRLIDISIENGGQILGGDAKCHAMEAAAHRALQDVSAAAQHDAEVVLGIGGGTGGEIILQVLRALPITFPKVLVSTLPFDPRIAVADNSIVIVPTLADINGLNGMLRDTLQNAAAMVAGLCRKERKGELREITPSVGITSLGVTDAAVRPLLSALRARGQEATTFHANGYGGAAYTRFAKGGAFYALVDLTPHELTRLYLAGPHVAMPDRFSAAGDLPRVTLPGGVNFVTLTDWSLAPDRFKYRAHYAHSAHFTHVGITQDEMTVVATKLAQELNALSGPQTVIVPMDGFSSEDAPGGAIEDPGLRRTFRTVLGDQISDRVQLITMDEHISAPAVTQEILRHLPKDQP